MTGFGRVAQGSSLLPRKRRWVEEVKMRGYYLQAGEKSGGEVTFGESGGDIFGVQKPGWE